MSKEDMDKKEFEFIKEQVIQKKHKKLRKWLLPFFSTIFMALLFGLVAAVTFCVAEPTFYKLLNKEEVKTPITFPTTYPEVGQEEVTPIVEKNDPIEEKVDLVSEPGAEDVPQEEKIIVNTIEAGIEDYLSISDEIRTIAYKSNKALATISSVVKGKDIFGNPSEIKVDTTGLIIGMDEKSLYILTSLDRVSNATSIKLKLSETDIIDAVLLDYETEINMAILTALLEDIPPLFLSNNIAVAELGESYTITLGSPVIALGSPNGYPGSMDFGYITSKSSHVIITDNKFDLFNTSIKDYKDGDGVIVNLKGEVIGIITRTLKEGLNTNLHTVVGISKIKSIIERMVNNEPRIYCGVIAEDLTDMARMELGVPFGIYVNDIQTNSPAYEAGLKGGDIILQINEKSVMNINVFYNTISSFNPGDEVNFTIKRTTSSTDKNLIIKLVLGKKVQ